MDIQNKTYKGWYGIIEYIVEDEQFKATARNGKTSFKYTYSEAVNFLHNNV